MAMIVGPGLGAGKPGEVTGLLTAWAGGDSAALVKLMPLVYRELRRIARRRLRSERENLTLQTTGLVHD